MEKVIAGKSVDVDTNGYLTDLSQWNKDIAIEIGKEEGINEVTPKHFEVLTYLQEQYKKDPTCVAALDEIGAQYALYSVCATGIQISGTKGTIADDKPPSVIKEKSVVPLYSQTSLALQ